MRVLEEWSPVVVVVLFRLVLPGVTVTRTAAAAAAAATDDATTPPNVA